MPFDKRYLFLNKVISFYFYGSIHIGLAAFAMSSMTFILLGANMEKHLNFLVAMGFGTCALYNIHRLADLDKLMRSSSDSKYKHILSIKGFLRWSPILFIASGAILISTLDFKLILFLAIGLMITLLYSLSLPGIKRKIREYNYIKIFVIAAVWALVTALLPSLILEAEPGKSVIVFIERAVFIFAITLPFDMRDMNTDKIHGVKTIPLLIGKRWSILTAVILLSIFINLLILYEIQAGIYEFKLGLILMLSNLLIAGFVLLAGKIKHDLYYTGILDGMMILQPVLLFIFSL